MTKTIHEHEGKKYLKTINSAVGELSVQIDVYSVLEAFGVTCPGRQQAIKKLLCCGNRGKGDELADLLGAEAALSRAIELQKQREDDKKKMIDQQLIDANLKELNPLVQRVLGQSSKSISDSSSEIPR